MQCWRREQNLLSPHVAHVGMVREGVPWHDEITVSEFSSGARGVKEGDIFWSC